MRIDGIGEMTLDQVIELWAKHLHVEPGAPINPAAILRAIAAVETSSGARSQASRHEAAYCYGGRYHNAQLAELSRTWGCAAHESWGPWQIMYVTAVEAGYRGDPVGLRDPEASIGPVLTVLNRRVMDKLADETPADIFDCWNSGNPRDSIVPADYIAKAAAAYSRFGGAP